MLDHTKISNPILHHLQDLRAQSWKFIFPLGCIHKYVYRWFYFKIQWQLEDIEFSLYFKVWYMCLDWKLVNWKSKLESTSWKTNKPYITLIIYWIIKCLVTSNCIPNFLNIIFHSIHKFKLHDIIKW